VNAPTSFDKATTLREKLVVIGNGMAGCRAVEEILTRDPERYSITIFGAEPRVNYNRIMLSPVLAARRASTRSSSIPPSGTPTTVSSWSQAIPSITSTASARW
jgi:hypothetical protein